MDTFFNSTWWTALSYLLVAAASAGVVAWVILRRTVEHSTPSTTSGNQGTPTTVTSAIATLIQRDTIENRKSAVRVFVTQVATVWVFAGSGILIVGLLFLSVDAEKLQIGKDIFMTVLPIATGIITYWFASRGLSSKNDSEDEQAK